MKYHVAFASAASVVFALVGVAQAGDPQGPSLGTGAYSASIKRVCAAPDTDDYVASLIRGEKLSVTLRLAKGSALKPRLTLVGPDGIEFVPPTLTASKNGTLLRASSFVVPATGRWCVRVSGDHDTEGAYVVTFAVSRAPAIPKKSLGVGEGIDAVFAFEGLEGALLDVKASWKDRQATVSLASIETPTGGRTTAFSAVQGKTSLSLKRQSLHGGDGPYKLHFTKSGAITAFSVAVAVTPQGRLKSGRPIALADGEPYLDLVDAPLRGIAGRPIRMTGGGFSAKNPPRVLFGASPAPSTMLPDGNSIEVLPPGMAEGAVVSVAVIGPDGQSCVRDAYFHYVPMPVLTDLVDTLGARALIGRSAGGAALALRGSGLEAGQTVRFGPTAATVTDVADTQMQLVLPAGAGSMGVFVDDEFGRRVQLPFQFTYLSPPSIASVVATGGASLGADRVAAGGGAVVVLSGANFLSTDVVTVGGVAATLTGSTAASLTIVAPPGAIGSADVVVTDPLGQAAVATGALRLVAWQDATSSRSPGRSGVDGLSAVRGVVGDLDGDGVADDLVLVSDASSPGTRHEFTRVLFGSSGALVDGTATRFPAAYSDPAAADDWRAEAVALGDFDGDGSTDIVIGGSPVPTDGADSFEARIFANDGLGTFAVDADSPRVRSAPWDVIDVNTGESLPLFTSDGASGGRVTAIAAADLDGDGAREIILATDRFRTGSLHFPLADVSFFGDDALALDVAAQWSDTGTTYDEPALRIFHNGRDEGLGFVDATFTRLPRGDASPGTSPAYHARDVQVGDVNGDGYPDIVVAWDNPKSVTPYGLVNAGADQARVATRVLINDGAGFFTDQTSSWLPAGSGNEFWQADRVVLADLNGDGRKDLVLLHHDSIDAYTGSTTHGRSALRVLRNDGPWTGFTDVTASALPSVPLAGTSDDNLRGTALAVFDFDGDARADIVVGTTASLASASGGAARSLRVLRGVAGLSFTDAAAFLPSSSADTGEAKDVLPAQLAGGVLSMLVVTETAPAKSVGGERLRVFDWIR